jgi:hypothetical protein
MNKFWEWMVKNGYGGLGDNNEPFLYMPNTTDNKAFYCNDTMLKGYKIQYLIEVGYCYCQLSSLAEVTTQWLDSKIMEVE